jgi:signal transduction histidine kinase
MNSLQLRLVAGLVVSLLVLFALLALLAAPAIRNLAENNMASRLQHDSETLLALLQVSGNSDIKLDRSAVSQAYTRPYSGHYFQIQTDVKQITSRSLWDSRLSVPGQVQASDVLHATGPLDQPLLMIVHDYRKNSIPVQVIVAEDLTALESDIQQFKQRFALIAGMLLIILVVIQVLIIRGGLQPLKRLRQELRQLESGELVRLSEKAPAEIQPMILEINRLIDVLGKRLQRSRNALGDLAHSLKRPLTVLTRLSEETEVEKVPGLQNSLQRQIQSMRTTTDHILKRARLAGESPVGPGYDVVSEINSLVDTLQKMYPQRNCKIEADIGAGLRSPLDREDFLELLGNLLDNAFKWATGTIRLIVRGDDSVLRIRVEDDGPGIADDMLATLGRRGSRADEQVDGHGLGLAIVHDITDLYGGSLELGRSETLGGLAVEVVLNIESRGQST